MTNTTIHNQKIIIGFWQALVILLIISCVMLFTFNISFQDEKKIQNQKYHLITLGYQLNKLSDYLTAEARNFTVSNNIQHLHNYWQEVLINKNRDNLIYKIKIFARNTKERQLLALAKRNSDALINTEMRAMKLVLTAYKIPPSLYPKPIQTFILSRQDKILPPTQKILLAQKLLFDQHYSNEKMQISGPIHQYNKIITTNLNHSLQKNVTRSQWLLYSLGLLILITTVLTLSILWLRIRLLHAT